MLGLMKSYSIILAEDDEAIRDIMTEILSHEGFEVYGVADGQEAIEILQERSFDLLITDYRMPRINGTQLLNWCRENNLDLPSILITANSDLLPINDAAIKAIGAKLFQKPVNIESLITTINEIRTPH